MGAIKATGRALHMIKLIILARLLVPSDFGLMGIALLSLAALQQFSKLGFDAALIQNEGDDIDGYLNTAWVMKIIRGVVVAGVLLLFAPSIAAFFDSPQVKDIIRGLAVLPVLISLRNPGMVYFSKDLRFHKRFIFEFTGNFTNFIGTIGFALVYPSVWAFVFGNIVQDFVKLPLSYWLHDYRPWPELDAGIVRELFGYGRWILGSGVVVFLINQGDDAFVGWLLSASALGFYQLAYRFSNAPATEVSSVFMEVIFPAYSQIQSNVDKLRNTYFKSIQLVTYISIPMATGIIVVTPVFVRVFLGDGWSPAITVMQLLAVWGLLRAVGAANVPLFQAIGRPDYATKIQIGQLAVIALVIYPLTSEFGIEGTALAIIAGGLLVAEPVSTAVAIRSVEGEYSTFLRIIAVPLFGSLVMGSAVYFVRELNVVGGAINFASLVVTGIVVYGATLVVMERQFDLGIDAILQDLSGAFR